MSTHVTLAQVAAAADVSLATASRALHGSPGRTVSPTLVDRVRRAADSLGYVVNVAAQAMARGMTPGVGLIVHDIADPHAATIASGVMSAASEHAMIVTMAQTGSDPELTVSQLEMLMVQRVQAVILAAHQTLDDDATVATADALATLVGAGTHVAVIGQDRLAVNTLVIDNRGGARRLARTLYSLGYRRFAVLTGPEQLVTSEERLAGFHAGLAAGRLAVAPENIISAPMTRDGGYAAATELLDRAREHGPDVDCVFAINDVMAVGAMAALTEQGYRIPDDVALAGFDGIAPLRDTTPALTTVDIPLADVGRRALDLALAVPTGGLPVVRSIPVEVVVRDSTPGLAAQ